MKTYFWWRVSARPPSDPECLKDQRLKSTKPTPVKS